MPAVSLGPAVAGSLAMVFDGVAEYAPPDAVSDQGPVLGALNMDASSWTIRSQPNLDRVADGGDDGGHPTAHAALMHHMANGSMAFLGADPSVHEFSSTNIVQMVSDLAAEANVSTDCARAMMSNSFLNFLSWQRLRQLHGPRKAIAAQTQAQGTSTAARPSGTVGSCSPSPWEDSRTSVACPEETQDHTELYQCLAQVTGRAWKRLRHTSIQTDCVQPGINATLPVLVPETVAVGAATSSEAPHATFLVNNSACALMTTKVMRFGRGENTDKSPVYFSLAPFSSNVRRVGALHFEVVLLRDGRYALRNYSRNGTRVQGRWVMENVVVLGDGDCITVNADIRIVFRVGSQQHHGEVPDASESPPPAETTEGGAMESTDKALNGSAVQ